MTDLKNIIALVFADADAAHQQHLATQSYAEHVALGEFYSGVREKVDALSEALIAMGQRVPPAEPAILSRLQQSFTQLQELRAACDGVPAAENLFDEVSACYLAAIYKLGLTE